jgi:exopolysaccharide biosynthesis polyprenyl glycosylphosphotransferase
VLTAIDLAPLLFLGWLVNFPAPEMRALSVGLLLVTVVMTATVAAREFRPRRRRILILGSSPMALKLIEEIQSSSNSRFIVSGIVDNTRPEDGVFGGARWLGRGDQLAEIITNVQPERIVVAVADRRDRLPLQTLLEARVRGIEVDDATDFYESVTGKIAIEALRPSMLILAKGFRNHGAPEMTARVVSMFWATIGFILCAPLLLLIAVAIKLNSRGPILFVQERAGRNGKPFGLLKFRTMHPCDAPRSEWVMDNLDRITSLGRWLRRFRLDELPQLLNVLRGEMNLIGPRPHPVGNHAIFMEQIAYYGLRSTVRPGVTGWAQCRYGYANNLEEETEKMRFDLFYIKNRSLWLDARIIVETVGIMVFGQGASQVRHPSPSRSAIAPAPRRAAVQRLTMSPSCRGFRVPRLDILRAASEHGCCPV